MKQLEYIHVGCGATAPKEWLNFDGSYTLKLQRLPIIGYAIKKLFPVAFASHVMYADVRKPLPVKNNSVKAIYNSHMLAQMTPVEMDLALKHMYIALQKGGVLRVVVPDLKHVIDGYNWRADQKPEEAAEFFNQASLMALSNRPKGIKQRFEAAYGFSRNAWLIDESYLKKKLAMAGFKIMRVAKFNDSKDDMFKLVEKEDRFTGAICIEAIK